MNQRLEKTISILMLAGIAMTSHNAFAYKAIGWHWYNELPFVKEKKERQEQEKQKVKKESEHSTNEEKENSSITAVAEMKRLREIVEEAKAKAILVPTEANVRNYIALQNHVTAKAAIFSRVWQKVLLDYPELDYRVINPTQNSAQALIYDEKRRKEDEAIGFFRERYGLLFFYRGNNPIDHELAKLVKAFTKENNISLKPISVDGRILEIFTASTVSIDDITNTASAVNNLDLNGIDHGQAKKLGIEYFPALILVEPNSKKIKPLNYGFISGTELRTRFLQIATDFHEGA